MTTGLLHSGKQFALKKLIRASREDSGRKLVMTLLVRDEADIVKTNIAFHLDHGVDFIVATDNGSIDGTDDILEDYARQGVLHLIREPEQNHAQSLWVNRMGRLALEQYQADILFHCDADEFWWPESGSLKRELCFRHSVDVLSVGVTNMIFVRTPGSESYEASCTHAVTRPLLCDNLGRDSMERSLYLFPYPVKVMYRTDKGYLDVGAGNHGIVNPPADSVQKDSADIRVVHYPLRSFAQFQRKVINGGAAMERNPSKADGWHWRRWYEAYKRGELRAVYDLLTLDESSCQNYAEQGVLSDWSSRHEKICSYR